MEKTTVSKKEIESRIQSKEDFEMLFGVEGKNRGDQGGFFLPSKRDITWKFIADILAGRKQMLKASEIKTTTIPPKFEGIRIEALWAEVKQKQEWSRFFPDYFGRTPDKFYFYGVGATLLPFRS